MEPSLGNLEEMILLVLMQMKDEAYGVSIHETYVSQTNHTITLSAVHTVLRRLEKKGFITSEMGGATADRGGRRKRLYTVTRFGYRTASALQAQRTRLWKFIPKLDFGLS